MVFRAPKSGTVSFNVKDGEPYLRQAGNSGGTVTLSLLVNDTVKQSVTLSTSNQKAADWANFDEIELNKGDVIRVTASCNSNPSRPSVHVTPIITYVDKAVVDTEAPDAPTAVRTADVTETTAKVAWAAALDNVATTGYNVYVNGEKVNTELVTATEYDLTGLTPATDYSVEIEAVDAAGNVSEKSEAVTFTTAKEPVTPEPTVVDKTELKATTAKADTALAATDKYTAESLKALQAVYDQYASVLNDKNATQVQVDEANKAIAKALNALVEKKTDDGKKDDGNKGDNKKDDTKVDDNKNNNSSNTSKSDNKTTTKVDNTKKAAKTGDTTNVAVWAFALAASAAAAGVVVKRKKEN